MNLSFYKLKKQACGARGFLVSATRTDCFAVEGFSDWLILCSPRYCPLQKVLQSRHSCDRSEFCLLPEHPQSAQLTHPSQRDEAKETSCVCVCVCCPRHFAFKSKLQLAHRHDVAQVLMQRFSHSDWPEFGWGEVLKMNHKDRWSKNAPQIPWTSVTSVSSLPIEDSETVS